IPINFARARKKLTEALRLYLSLTGRHDLPTQRILDYIAEHSAPSEDFLQVGMRVDPATLKQPPRSKLTPFSETLLNALHWEFYQSLLSCHEWERHLITEWRSEGEEILGFGEEPDGVYYIEAGEVLISDESL